MEPIGFDPSVINQTTTDKFVTGQTLEYRGSYGNSWVQFFKLADAVNGTSGMIAEAGSATDPWTVTVDRAGGSSLGRMPRCVLLGNVTAGRYFFGLILGYHPGVKDAAGALTTVGRKIVPHATTDGDAAEAAATITRDIMCIGQTVVASSGGVAGVWVQRGLG